MREELFKIHYQEIDGELINAIVKEVNNYKGNKVIAYDIIKTNNEKYVIGYERDFTELEIQNQIFYAEMEAKQNVLNLVAAFGKRSVN